MSDRQPRFKDRNRRIAEMFRAGSSRVAIAAELGLGFQAVTYALKCEGIDARGPKRAPRGSPKPPRGPGKRVRKLEVAFGLPYAAIAAIDPTISLAFRGHRNGAKRRGIPFLLSFPQWWAVWEASGKFEQRGRRIGQFCMSRVGDAGAYEIGNVFIQLTAENSRDGALIGRAVTGVWASTSPVKPFRAVYRKRHLGCFASEAEAIEAYRQARLVYESAVSK